MLRLLFLTFSPSGILSFFAVFGSSIQFLAVYLDKKLQNTSNTFILSLGCSDLIVGVWTLPTIATSVYHRSWVLTSPICQFSAFVDSIAITASLWTLGFTALDRYMLVRSPIRYKSMMKRSKALQLISIVWIISIASASPPLIGWSGYEFSSFSMSCAMSSTSSFSDVNKYYFLFYTLITFPVPIALIIVSYVFIFRYVLTRHQKGRQITANNLRTAQITFILTIFVLACILPTFILGLIFWCQFFIPISERSSKIVIWLLLGNSAFNPLLYGWLNKQFRDAYKNMIWCLIHLKKYSEIKKTILSTTTIKQRRSIVTPFHEQNSNAKLGWTDEFQMISKGRYSLSELMRV